VSYWDTLDPKYRLILCDIWGVVHDGVNLYPNAIERLKQWRANGRIVVLITNAPRTADAVEQQLKRLGLPRECWDEIDWMFAEWRFFATPLCRRVFQGTVPPGGACCNSAECTTEVCFAVGGCSLEPLVPVGGTCDNVNLLCDVGLECGTDSKCAVPPPSGVILPDEGQPCDWNIPNPCRRFDDYCDPDTDVCTRRIQPGAPCTSIEFPCVRYAGCTNGVCTSSPGLGAYCAAEGACIGGLTCINNVCSAWPTPSPGTCGL